MTTPIKPFPSYNVMIQRLFNTNTHNQYAGLMHACAALLGEAVELNQFTSPENFVEECGDIEFYIEAACQHFQLDMDGALQVAWTFPLQKSANAAEAFVNVVNISNEIFDIAKKAWVYGKDPSPMTLTFWISSLHQTLSVLYTAFGTTRDHVLKANQEKLIGPKGRFRDGFYKDADAIARADKAQEFPAAPVASARDYIGSPPMPAMPAPPMVSAPPMMPAMPGKEVPAAK